MQTLLQSSISPKKNIAHMLGDLTKSTHDASHRASAVQNRILSPKSTRCATSGSATWRSMALGSWMVLRVMDVLTEVLVFQDFEGLTEAFGLGLHPDIWAAFSFPTILGQETSWAQGNICPSARFSLKLTRRWPLDSVITLYLDIHRICSKVGRAATCAIMTC